MLMGTIEDLQFFFTGTVYLVDVILYFFWFGAFFLLSYTFPKNGVIHHWQRSWGFNIFFFL